MGLTLLTHDVALRSSSLRSSWVRWHKFPFSILRNHRTNVDVCWFFKYDTPISHTAGNIITSLDADASKDRWRSVKTTDPLGLKP